MVNRVRRGDERSAAIDGARSSSRPEIPRRSHRRGTDNGGHPRRGLPLPLRGRLDERAEAVERELFCPVPAVAWDARTMHAPKRGASRRGSFARAPDQRGVGLAPTVEDPESEDLITPRADDRSAPPPRGAPSPRDAVCGNTSAPSPAPD